MSKVISGKEALKALADGEVVEFCYRDVRDSIGEVIVIDHFMNDKFEFRLKPRTISINGIELPKHFEPKAGDDCRCYYINTSNKIGYAWYHSLHHRAGEIAWRTEEEVKQVVGALRSILNDI